MVLGRVLLAPLLHELLQTATLLELLVPERVSKADQGLGVRVWESGFGSQGLGVQTATLPVTQPASQSILSSPLSPPS